LRQYNANNDSCTKKAKTKKMDDCANDPYYDDELFHFPEIPWHLFGQVWQEWLQMFRDGMSDPAMSGYYEAGIVLLSLASILAVFVVCYYVARCAAKTFVWMVNMALWAIIGMVILSLMLAVSLVLVPWVAQTVGLGHWFSYTTPHNNYSHVSRMSTVLGSPLYPGMGTVELEVDAETGERVRVPTLGKSVYRESEQNWWRYMHGTASAWLGEDMAHLLSESKMSDAWTWAVIKYATKWTGRTIWSTASSTTWTVVDTMARMFRRSQTTADQGPDPFGDGDHGPFQ
jgi:hypothetical protein